MSTLRTQWRFFKKTLVLAHSYLKHPYRFQKHESYNTFSHVHTCMLIRLAPTDFDSLCPLVLEEQPKVPGDCDACELCRYFGTINYRIDQTTNTAQIQLELDDRLVVTHNKR